MPGQAGRALDREAATGVVVAALAGFDRASHAAPRRRRRARGDERHARARRAAAPRRPLRARAPHLRRRVLHVHAAARWSGCCELPADGASRLRVKQEAPAGASRTSRAASPARPGTPTSPSARTGASASCRRGPGRELNVAATSAALLQAASRLEDRTAAVVVAEFEPRMTTAEAKALRVERQLASYATLYAGTADRINNLQLAIEILDGARIASGGDVVVQRVRRAAHRRARLPRRAGDHGRQVRGGRRRRRLAGGDDRLQRGLGGRDQDRRAPRARPLHQPLPGRARRHRQLPGRRPEARPTTRRGGS